MNFAELTDTEQLLWDACPRSEWVDLREGAISAEDLAETTKSGKDRVVRADVIRALLLGAAGVKPGWAAGVRLRGVVVKGSLDLMGAAVACALTCECCYFEHDLSFAESSTRTVSIVNCRLPGFNGTRMRLDGILNLRASVISGAVRLEQARILGQLCLSESTVSAPPGGLEAVAAQGLTVDGSVNCRDLDARGSVALRSAAITGSVDFTSARVASPGREALVMDYSAIGGKLECGGIFVDGQIRIHNCRVTASLTMQGARLENPGGIALNAGGLTIGGGVFLTEMFTAQGEIRLIGAQLGANLTLTGARLENPGGLSLNLERASIGVLQGEQLQCLGQLNLVGARVAGDLNLAGAVVEVRDGRPAVSMERASIDGALILMRMRVLGELNLRTVRVGVRLVLSGSTFDGPAGTACRLSRAQIAADIYGDGMITAGSLRLAGTSVGGAVTLKHVQLSCASGLALDAPALQANELILQPATPIQGGADLSYAAIGVLRDVPGTWPDQVCLEGFTYRALDPMLPARERLSWLARDPRGHQSQPYEQLAALYDAAGQPGQARSVLYAREQTQRMDKAALFRVWSMIQDITVGYGYRPRRALAWLALLLGTGSIVFSVAPPPPLQAGAAPHFNGIMYTLDLLLPVVNLGQKYAFNPGSGEQWLSYVLMAAGWTLATTVAAGAARILRRS